MPVLGDTYTVELRDNHIGWGEVRNTDSRPEIRRETYIQIPSEDAYRIGILRGQTFNFQTADRSFTGVLRASGNQHRDEFAKQFHTDGALQELANWLLDICNAKAGDFVNVTWVSDTNIELSHTST